MPRLTFVQRLRLLIFSSVPTRKVDGTQLYLHLCNQHGLVESHDLVCPQCRFLESLFAPDGRVTATDPDSLPA